MYEKTYKIIIHGSLLLRGESNKQTRHASVIYYLNYVCTCWRFLCARFDSGHVSISFSCAIVSNLTIMIAMEACGFPRWHSHTAASNHQTGDGTMCKSYGWMRWSLLQSLCRKRKRVTQSMINDPFHRFTLLWMSVPSSLWWFLRTVVHKYLFLKFIVPDDGCGNFMGRGIGFLF